MADVMLSEVIESVRRLAPTLDISLNLKAQTSDPSIGEVRLDSRRVNRGDLFACLPGEVFDGHTFAGAAVDAGATTLLVERPLDFDIAEVRTPNTREVLGWMASAFHGNPSRQVSVVGITGTNGKTTSAHLLAEVLGAAERQVLTIGTLSGAHTTPEAPDLHRQIAAAVGSGLDAVVMEVSSHALSQHRVTGTWFEVAAFTNLSLDHLDFHGSFESYFEAKASLFAPDRCGVSVIDVGSEIGRRLCEMVATDVVEVSVDEVTDLELGPGGSTFRFDGQEFTIGLPGRFNVSNALVVVRCAQQLGLGLAEIAAGLATASPVPGRVEPINAGQGFTVLVDYAHSPDGLAKVLGAARELTAGKVIVVFGAGGDRDRSKRPEMGMIAGTLADFIVVTTDNPRSETANSIIDEIVGGFEPASNPFVVEPDRRSGIRIALESADNGDIVVIAGKGHEAVQIIGDRRIDFDDRQVARELLADLGCDGSNQRDETR